jgi:hypothetical protein
MDLIIFLLPFLVIVYVLLESAAIEHDTHTRRRSRSR